MKKLLILFSTIIILGACNPCKYVAKHQECFPPDTVKISEIKTVTDSIYFTEPDSMAISMLFECDSNNNVLMCELTELSSKGVETNVIFKNNRLDITGFVDSIAVLNKLVETLKSKDVSKVNPVNVQLKRKNEKLVVRNKVKNKLLMGAGGLILLLGVFLYIKI